MNDPETALRDICLQIGTHVQYKLVTYSTVTLVCLIVEFRFGPLDTRTVNIVTCTVYVFVVLVQTLDSGGSVLVPSSTSMGLVYDVLETLLSVLQRGASRTQ